MAEPTAVLAAELSADPSKLIDGFKRAEQATGAWAQAAQRNMQTVQASIGGVDFSVTTSKARAETLKMVELEHQLTVARAAGEKETVAQLTEEIALLSKVRQLRSAGLAQPEAMTAAKAHFSSVAAAGAAAAARQAAEREAAEAAEAAAARRERVVGNPGEALAGVFSRSRLAVLEEGSARIPVFGSSLEALGGAGLAAAAGLAAVGIAAEHARQSLEFAEEIEKTARALGVGTTALQEFDQAAIATGVGQDKAREGLQSFNQVFGKYSAGLANGRTAKFLDALGFTPASARQIGDTTEALEKALTALAKLQNPQQRASLASQLGLEGFLPVIAEGQEGVEKFIGAMHEAGQSGTIISPEQIQRAAELNDKIELLSHRMETEFKQAFIDAGPSIEKVAEFIELCTRNLAKFLGDAIAGFQKLDEQGSDYLLREVKREQAGIDVDGKVAGVFGVKKGPDGRYSGGFPGMADQLNTRLDRVHSENVQVAQNRLKSDGLTATTQGRPGQDFTPAKKEKRGPADQTADFDKSAKDAADTAAKELASAQAALTKNIQAHADAELRAVDADTAKKLTDLAAEEVKVRQSKNDAHKASQLALLETAKADTQVTAAAKKELIAREATAAQAAADLQFQQQQDQYQDTILTAQASLATSAQQRADLQLQVFRDEQARAYESRAAANAQKVTEHQLTPEAAAEDNAGFKAAQSADLIAKRTEEQRQINPLYAEAHPTNSVADDLQGIEAQGLSQVTDDLAHLATNAADAKQVFHDLITSMIADLIKLGLQRQFEAPLADALFGAQSTNNLGNLGQTGGLVSVGGLLSGVGGIIGGAPKVAGANYTVDTSGLAALDALTVPAFAAGTDDAPGGLTRYDDIHGTEGYVPPGAQIIPNSTLQGLAQLTPDKLGSAGGTVVQQFHLHAEGAVMTDELLASMDAKAQVYAGAALASARGDQATAAKAQRNSTAGY